MPSVPQPYRNAFAGRIAKLAGWAVMFVGMVFVFGAHCHDSPELMLYGLAAIAAGYFVWFRGSRIAALPAEALLSSDKRPPVVFIRSFGEEEHAYRPAELFGLVGRAMTSIRAYNRIFQAGASSWGPVMQWQLDRLFGDIGPFVAIGRPGEKLAGMGAARLYVDDSEWQTVVSGMFRRARLIVVAPGTTPGLRWEIAEVKRTVSPEKILFILPEREEQYRAPLYILE